MHISLQNCFFFIISDKIPMTLNDNLPQNGIKSKINDTYASRVLHSFQQGNVYDRMRTLGFLLLFLFAFPITLIITVITLVLHLATRKQQTVNPNAKRILISGGGMTKSLQLVRSFYSAGHYIVLTEEYPFTTHGFSLCFTLLCLW